MLEGPPNLQHRTAAQRSFCDGRVEAGPHHDRLAHRLSTVRAADRILVFEHVRIVEQGRHADRVQHDGPYARLHALAHGELSAAE